MPFTVNDFEEAVAALAEQMNELSEYMHDTLSAFGARWGLRSEAAWRRGVAATLQGLGFHVEQFRAIDQQGIVFAEPDWVETDTDQLSNR